MSSVVVGLALALVASAALNSSYVLQHVGSADAPAIDARRPIATFRALLSSPIWALRAFRYSNCSLLAIYRWRSAQCRRIWKPSLATIHSGTISKT